MSKFRSKTATSKPIYLQKKRIDTYIYIKVRTIRGKQRKRYHITGEQHVKKIYSTVAIDKRGHAINPVCGYSFTGEDTNTCVPWL